MSWRKTMLRLRRRSTRTLVCVVVRDGTHHTDCLTEKRDMEIQELKREVERYEEACQDLERTISQFRELVLNLQSCVPLYSPP